MASYYCIDRKGRVDIVEVGEVVALANAFRFSVDGVKYTCFYAREGKTYEASGAIRVYTPRYVQYNVEVPHTASSFEARKDRLKWYLPEYDAISGTRIATSQVAPPADGIVVQPNMSEGAIKAVLAWRSALHPRIALSVAAPADSNSHVNGNGHIINGTELLNSVMPTYYHRYERPIFNEHDLRQARHELLITSSLSHKLEPAFLQVGDVRSSVMKYADFMKTLLRDSTMIEGTTTPLIIVEGEATIKEV